MRNFCFPDPGRDAMHPSRYDALAHGCNATSKHLLTHLPIPNRRPASRPSFILCLVPFSASHGFCCSLSPLLQFSAFLLVSSPTPGDHLKKPKQIYRKFCNGINYIVGSRPRQLFHPSLLRLIITVPTQDMPSTSITVPTITTNAQAEPTFYPMPAGIEHTSSCDDPTCGTSTRSPTQIRSRMRGNPQCIQRCSPACGPPQQPYPPQHAKSQRVAGPSETTLHFTQHRR